MKKSKSIRLAIIGTGGMANTHASSFAKIKSCQLVAACDVDLGRAMSFAEKHSIEKSYGSIDDLLSDHEQFDAVSVVTPDAFHAPISIACLKAKKHVLCEKPLALNYADTNQMVAAAKKAGTVNMVNFSYRNWPCIEAAAASINKGAIGEIRHVEASYMQAWLPSKIWGDWKTSPTWLWRLSTKHGSKGVLGDVGVHIADYATYPCGPVKEVYCRLKAFPKAKGNRIGEYVLDANDSATINVEFKNGALGIIHTSRWIGGHANRLSLLIAGTEGTLKMDSDTSTSSYAICNGKNLDACKWETVECKQIPTIYERFVDAILKGKQATPDFSRGSEIQKILDACFVSSDKNIPVRLN